MIEVKNVSKRYGKHYALDDVSFTVETGKIYGLLGENGAGKSTTMNIMTGYLAPSEGQVTVDKFDILKHAKKAKAKIGYLPEIPPLYQDMSVYEYLKFVAQLKNIPGKSRKQEVKLAMENAKISDVKNRLIRNLSKGYKQRVGIAQAILGSPEIVILDEPTVGLDPVQIKEIRDLIREIGREHTVILSSHILSEITEVCDHVFMISGGKLVLDEDMSKIDSLEEVFIEHSSSKTVEKDAPVFEESEEESKAEDSSEAEEVSDAEDSSETKDGRKRSKAEKKEEKLRIKEEKLRLKEEKKEEKLRLKEEKIEENIRLKNEKREAKEKAKRQARVEKRREARRKKKANKEEK